MRIIFLLVFLCTQSHQDSGEDIGNNLLDAMRNAVSPKPGEKELQLFGNLINNTLRVVDATTTVAEWIISSLDDYTNEKGDSIRKLFYNVSNVIRDMDSDDTPISKFYDNEQEEQSKKLRNVLLTIQLMNKNSMERILTTCEQSYSDMGFRAIEYIIKRCNSSYVDFDILGEMATILGYRFTEDDEELLEKYGVIYSYLKYGNEFLYIAPKTLQQELRNAAQKLNKNSFKTQLDWIDAVFSELLLHHRFKGCLLEYSLVSDSFKRNLMERTGLTIARHLLMLLFKKALCIPFVHEKETARAELQEQLKNTIKRISGGLETITEKLLNSTWPLIQSRQIKEIVERIPDKDLKEKNASFYKIAKKIHRSLFEVGHLSFETQYLVTPYSPKNIDFNPSIWYHCRPNVCQFIQIPDRANVLAIRLERSYKELKANSTQLQTYVKSIEPAVMKAFDKKYFDASTPRNVLRNLKHQENIDLAKLKHSQVVIVLHYEAYFAKCYQKMAVTPFSTLDTPSIHYYYDAKLNPLKFCQSWYIMFV